MYNLSSEAVRGGTLCLSKAGLVEGSAPAKIQHSAPNGLGIDYAIDGILYNHLDSAGDDFWVLTGDAMAIASECLWIMLINAAGVSSVVKGVTVLTADIDSGFVSLKWPAPSGPLVCPVGGIKIVTVLSTFTPGTTSVNGIVTYYDFFAIPEQDIVT